MCKSAASLCLCPLILANVSVHDIHVVAGDASACFGRHIHSNDAISMALNIGKPDKLSAIVPLSV